MAQNKVIILQLMLSKNLILLPNDFPSQFPLSIYTAELYVKLLALNELSKQQHKHYILYLTLYLACYVQSYCWCPAQLIAAVVNRFYDEKSRLIP